MVFPITSITLLEKFYSSLLFRMFYLYIHSPTFFSAKLSTGGPDIQDWTCSKDSRWVLIFLGLKELDKAGDPTGIVVELSRKYIPNDRNSSLHMSLSWLTDLSIMGVWAERCSVYGQEQLFQIPSLRFYTVATKQCISPTTWSADPHCISFWTGGSCTLSQHLLTHWKAQVMSGNLVGNLAEEALLCDERVDAGAPILTNFHLSCVIEPADDHLRTRKTKLSATEVSVYSCIRCWPGPAQ